MTAEGVPSAEDELTAAVADPGSAVTILLRRVAVQLSFAGAEFAARSDMNATDLRAIIELLDAERVGDTATPSWLADRLRLSTASVTAIIDRLEHAGHVVRARDQADRRRVRLTATDRAKQLSEAFFGPLTGQVVRILRGFHPAEREAISRFLGVIADTAGSGWADNPDDQRSAPAASEPLRRPIAYRAEHDGLDPF